MADAVRAKVKARDGFATLTADQSNHVLRPVAAALPNTSDNAVSPSLLELRDGIRNALESAEEEANENLDQILSETTDSTIRKVPLGLRNREIGSKAELEALLDEVRRLVEPELAEGRRVRLV